MAGLRNRERGFDFAAEVEAIGIGTYEFVGRVALTFRVSLFCPRLFRRMVLADMRRPEGAPRLIAREIPYFLFAYGLTILLLVLLDHLVLKIIQGDEVDLGTTMPFLKSLSEKLLDLDVLTWAFVIVPVLIGLHYGILIFDRIVRNRRPHPRQTTYDPGAMIVYYVANNIIVPTAAAIAFALIVPVTDRHINEGGPVGLIWAMAALLFIGGVGALAVTPVLLLVNSISFIRVMAAVYGVPKTLFAFRALLAGIPLGLIALALWLVIESIFIILNAPPAGEPPPLPPAD